MTILGTRPEIIRLSRVLSVFDEVFDHIIVHTGQNYDHELNEIFFQELSVRKPDHFLQVDTSSLGRSLGDILIKTEEVLLLEKPDAVLVLGDTNSAISLLMAKRMKVPTYHMEAGNRSFDANVPEEINRKMVDHLADFNPHDPSPENQLFVSKFFARYGRTPDTWAAQGYDALHILAKAIKFTGSRNPLDISYAIRYSDVFNGANGRYKFDRSGNLDEKPIYLYMIRHGVPVLVQ